VLVAHGEPKAVIIGVEELRQLEQNQAEASVRQIRYVQALAAADRLREEAQQWQEEHGIPATDSVETLRTLREMRDDELSSLR